MWNYIIFLLCCRHSSIMNHLYFVMCLRNSHGCIQQTLLVYVHYATCKYIKFAWHNVVNWTGYCSDIYTQKFCWAELVLCNMWICLHLLSFRTTGMVQGDKNLLILQGQPHGCCWPCDAWSREQNDVYLNDDYNWPISKYRTQTEHTVMFSARYVYLLIYIP